MLLALFKFKYKRHIENLDRRLQLTTLGTFLGRVYKNLQAMSVLMEALMQAPFTEAVANKRKRKDALSLEELFDLDLRL
jgi:hypothetical protein